MERLSGISVCEVGLFDLDAHVLSRSIKRLIFVSG